jgi:hypothetical protein
MSDIDKITGPYKVALRIEKFHSEEERLTGVPFEDETTASWHDPDGSEITDPARIAELEQIAKEQADGPRNSVS